MSPELRSSLLSFGVLFYCPCRNRAVGGLVSPELGVPLGLLVLSCSVYCGNKAVGGLVSPELGGFPWSLFEAQKEPGHRDHKPRSRLGI